MSIFTKQEVYCIDYYVNDHRKPFSLNKRQKKGKRRHIDVNWVMIETGFKFLRRLSTGSNKTSSAYLAKCIAMTTC
jgi:hypothetical protein